MNDRDTDIVVVGAGNAALCAALAAREKGAHVIMLESAPEAESGGNTRFTAGAMRVVYNGVDDLSQLMPDLSQAEKDRTDFGSYSAGDFYDDMARVTQYRTSLELSDLVVSRSFPTLLWMREKGVRFAPIYGRQAFKVDGRFKFWGGLTVEAWGGGPGLVSALTQACRLAGIEILYDCRAERLLRTGDSVTGVVVRAMGRVVTIAAKAVVLASGGFEANPEWRTRYLGPGWDLAKVRGTRFNQGDGLRMALDIGAAACGNWSGCHAVGWERNAPDYGDLAVGDNFQKHSYPFGIMINARGRRFVDEGADFRNYTYAKYGRVILEQPEQFAWQIFDSKVTHLLRDEYRIKQVTKVTADTIEELVRKLGDVDQEQALREIRAYNDAVDTATPFNPNVKDGRAARELDVPKSNWANRLDTPPYEAYAVTCGITFTFGGLSIDSHARVLDVGGKPILGLFAAGELVGGIFYFNYPGGTGLTSGAVFGRIAGASAGSLIAGVDIETAA
ncbi:FAD-dependent tricarballylate dehydrogenase TcuA [Taklimakanibacter deserti]|uniref:FAD-dependent tricarballylate dehydrogenase TcuA n=1 Tax=Taklimakanibacter deserti TaxID=2267839 RepID=UPI000E659E21